MPASSPEPGAARPLGAPSPTAGLPVLPPTPPPPAQGWTRYLGVNEVHGVAWAPDGALWAATAGGVARWDVGAGTYTQYTAGDGLASDYCNDVAVAPDGSVWVATLEGISRLAGGSWASYTLADGIAGGPVQSIAVTPDGEVWAGTLSGVNHFDGRSWTHALEGVRAWQVAVAPDGSVWVANDGAGVSRYSPADRTWTTLGTQQGLPNAGVKTVAVAPDGGVWIYVGYDQVYRFGGTSWLPVPDIAVPWVTDIAFDAGGAAWIATGPGLHGGGYGLLAPRGDAWERMTSEQGLGSDTLLAIAAGPDGTIAAGTTLGLSVYRDERWHTLRGGPTRNQVVAAAVTPDGAVWLGFGDFSAYRSGGGVARLDHEGWQYFLEGENVAVLAVDRRGTLWAGAGCGLWRWDGRAWQGAGAGCDTLKGDIIDLAFGADGAVWVASGMKLAIYDGREWAIYDRLAHSVDVAPEGTVWIAAWKGSQGSEYSARFDGTAWVEYPGSRGALLVTPDGQVWGTAPDEGLVRFDGQGWAAYAPQTGVGPDAIDRLAVGPDGSLWASGDGDLARLKEGTWEVYAGAGAGAIAFAPDGSLWLGTGHGAVHWSPLEEGP